MKRKKRRFLREFKIEVIREIEQGAKQAEVCRKHGLILYWSINGGKHIINISRLLSKDWEHSTRMKQRSLN